MIRREDGRPWFIHGVGFDITELKQTEEALAGGTQRRVRDPGHGGALVVVLDPQGQIVRFNRACEQITGYSFDEVEGKFLWDLCIVPEEADALKRLSSNCAGEQR